MKIDNYLNGSDEIPLEIILRTFTGTSIYDKAKARELVIHSQSRIVPSPKIGEIARPLVGYYIDCILFEREELKSDFVHSRFEAAKELQRVFEVWAYSENVALNEQAGFLVNAITEAYLHGNESARNVIETGFLEHVFELTRNRSYFSHWRMPPFRDAFLACEKWGDSHTRNAGEQE